MWRFETIKPGPVAGRHGVAMAPHVNLWIVARGINVGLHTRMYFDDEAAANAADPVLNLVYAPTGNSSPDYFDGELRTKEAEENASSIVAIDAATGQRRWVYQTVHRDIWDYDVPSQPVLVDVRKNGQGEPIPAVIGCTTS